MEVKEDKAKGQKNLKTEKQSKIRKQDVKKTKKDEEKKENTNGLKKDETNDANGDVPKQEISAERLAQLKDPRRVKVVMEHRKAMKMFKSFPQSANYVTNLSIQPSKQDIKATQQFAEMKPITIRKINPNLDHIYKRFKLKCTIVDEPVFSFGCIAMIVEDDNGDIQRIAVYDIEQNNEVYTKFGYNCKITILNPYFRIAADGKSVIRVDDISNVIFEASPDLSRCRYCGKNGLFMKCGNCNKATYCTRNCQKEDWKLGHKYICANLL